MVIAYLDECARGNLFGDVFAGACIPNEILTEPPPFCVKTWDSKKISAKKRKILAGWIKQNSVWSIGRATPSEIDEMNILNATMLAFHRALDKLEGGFDEIYVDGTRFQPYISKKTDDFVPHKCFEKGDNIYSGIGMASILAKVAHDEYIDQLCTQNPQLERYKIRKNSGYGTREHIDGIREFGYTTLHRMSFKIKSLNN